MKKILLLILILSFPLLSFAEVKIIEVTHRAAGELEPQVRGLLEDGEKVQAAGSHLILIADGETLQAAEKLIALLDKPQRNLLVRVRQSEEQQQVGKDAAATVHYGTKSGLTAAAETGFRRGNSSSAQEQTLHLVEGGKGLIEIGREIPFTEQWSVATGDTIGYAEKTAYKTIATGFWVYPLKVVGDKVLVDVEPYVSNANQTTANQAPQIDYSQLRTHLQVPIGVWYPLGSHLMHRDKVSQAIISWRSSDNQIDRQLQIRIDPVE